MGTASVGGEALHLSGLTIAGANPGDYGIAANGCASIPAQGSCTIDVTFAPQAQGDRPAILQFSGDDRMQTVPVSVALDGTGVAHASATTINCPPGKTTVGAALTCTLTVSDTAVGAASAPSGSVALSSDSAGAVRDPGYCALFAAGLTGQASCSLTYTPSAVGTGRHRLTARYGGDTTHVSSVGTLVLAVATSGGRGRSGPTSKQIKASLSAQLAPRGSAAKINALMKADGYGSSFKALSAGNLKVDWYLLAIGGSTRRKPVLAATRKLSFAKAGTARLTLKLTAAGMTAAQARLSP